jgi:hypothetical protein
MMRLLRTCVPSCEAKSQFLEIIDKIPANVREADLGIRSLFTKSPQKLEVYGTKALVCGLHPKFDELIKDDSNVYSQFYPSTTVTPFTGIVELLGRMRGFDIVHLFADVSPTGIMADTKGKELVGTDLIGKCCDSDVKLLWVASDNEPDGYIKGFKVAKPLNLVMTINRNGASFSTFLGQLLSRMSSGETMPTAWAAVAPQTQHDPQQAHLPATIFSAGRGGVKLL